MHYILLLESLCQLILKIFLFDLCHENFDMINFVEQLKFQILELIDCNKFLTIDHISSLFDKSIEYGTII